MELSKVLADYKPADTAETLGLCNRKNSGLGLRTPNNVIMKTTRHKSSKMIDDYTSDHDLINNNATSMLPYREKDDYIFAKLLTKFKSKNYKLWHFLYKHKPKLR